MGSTGPLYLGFDLSTQQLKGLLVDSTLKVLHSAKFDFDADSRGFPSIHKGVLTNPSEHEVFAPVAMWLQALDNILEKLKKEPGNPLQMVQGISGAGQQHGSVFWGIAAERRLATLDSGKSLEEQLVWKDGERGEGVFSHPYSPNWQDASTQRECDEFDALLGGETELAEVTGSKAHHRFTGPQIRRFRNKHPDAYNYTSRISLISSFLASLLLGKIAPIDISDVCGMNLWEIKKGDWSQKALELAGGEPGDASGASDLRQKLGRVEEDGGVNLGNISPYYVERYGFPKDCSVICSTGDNPSTILALPLRPLDAIVSLGTSTTFLMSTPQYKPDPAVHFFNSPTTAGLYMFMLCYKNGGLAREQVRDALNGSDGSSNAWENFDSMVLSTAPAGQSRSSDGLKLGLYFPRPEIVPNLPSGTWRYIYNSSTKHLEESTQGWNIPADDARAIVESQLLSCRLRSRALVHNPVPGSDLPPQPRRIYLVGGGSRNLAIAKLVGEVLGGSEGIFKLDVGENACALGAAYKAVWAVERKAGETFEDLIGKRWREEEFAEKIAEGYQKGVFEKYGEAVDGFEQMEQELLQRYARGATQ